MFDLHEKTVRFTNLNTRAEKNGDTPKSAADLNFSGQFPKYALDELAPGLSSLLYKAPSDPDLADKAVDDPDVDLRLPLLALPLDYNLVLDDCKLTIDYGLGGGSNVVIDECRIHKFKLTPQVGGTVVVGFQVSGHPSGKIVDWLFEHMGLDITISLEQKEPAQGDLLPAASAPKQSKKEKQAAALAEAQAAFEKTADTETAE